MNSNSTSTSNSTTAGNYSEIIVVVIGALVFIISFMWKDFFTDVEQFVFAGNPTLTEKFFYISFISIIVIGIIIYLKNIGLATDSLILNQLDNSPIDTGDG